MLILKLLIFLCSCTQSTGININTEFRSTNTTLTTWIT